jgi:hypothetical protein
MDLYDKLPLRVLKGIRDAVSRVPADEAGMVTNTIPALKNGQTPFRISVNKEAYLATVEAAIVRRGEAEAGAAR